MAFTPFFLLYSCTSKFKKKDTNNKLKLEILGNYEGNAKLGYLVESVKLNGDFLIFNIVYEGGCKPHSFRLIGDSLILKSKPPQTNLYLLHENNGDKCTEKIKKELIFDVSRLKNFKYNPLILNIDHLNSVTYEYK